MPRATRIKRPLAEADPNASNAPKSTKPTKRKAKTQDAENVPSEQEIKVKKMRGKRSPTEDENSRYRMTDNSKLRVLLRDRGLPTDGTREEMIKILERCPPIDYESMTVDELTEIMRRRNMKYAASLPKEVKIERLRPNDNYDRDTGAHDESTLWVRVATWSDLAKREDEAGFGAPDYSSKTMKQLSKLLERRNLSTAGTQTTLVSRLQKDDQERHSKLRKQLEESKARLEILLGHPVEDNMWDLYEEYQAHDNEIINRARSVPEPPKHICDFDWKDSHWASRSEHELSEICSRREMPGAGPKAAMIKWLETGEVEYEDLYAFSLETMCDKRGIKLKSHPKKADMVRLLKEADAAEAN